MPGAIKQRTLVSVHHLYSLRNKNAVITGKVWRGFFVWLQDYTVDIYMRQTWQDERLKFNSDKFSVSARHFAPRDNSSIATIRLSVTSTGNSSNLRTFGTLFVVTSNVTTDGGCGENGTLL